MVRLYKKNNKFSVHRMKDSEICEIDEVHYNGLELLDSVSPTGYELKTKDNEIFKITDDNFNIIVRSSVICNGRLVGNFKWQPYKNKWLLLPDGLLDQNHLNAGDIVEPVISRSYRSPSKLIYLGIKDIVEYSAAMSKTVKKSQHVFVSLDPDFKNEVYSFHTIKSAFFKTDSDVNMASEMSIKINTNELYSFHDNFDRSRREFYVDSFKGTKVIPVLKQIPAISPRVIRNNYDVLVVIDINGEFYQVKHSRLIFNSASSPATKLKKIDICDDEVIVNINKSFHPKKCYIENQFDIVIPKSYDLYVVVFELYQNGILIGRK